MQLLELEIDETLTIVPGVRVTILSIREDGARLEIDAPAGIRITSGDSPDPSPTPAG